MNVLGFLVGVSIGWAADKLYKSYIAKQNKADEESDTIEAEEKDIHAKSINNEDTSTVKRKTENKPAANKKNLAERHDDLSQLKGVGPKLTEALNSIGIYNYKQLSEPSIDGLLEQLKGTGGRFNKQAISLVMERAKQATKEK